VKEEVKKGGQTMKDLIEKTILLGVGAASMTREKLEALVGEFVKRGELTREEGQKLMEEASSRAMAEGAVVKGKAAGAYQEALQSMGIATAETVEALERRISVLEAKVYGEPPRFEEPATGFSSTTTEE
jgi:polyhydroxyalkanoate synthesis regulator phasin